MVFLRFSNKPKRSVLERPPRDGLPVLMMTDQKGKYMKDYTKFMSYALFTMIDRKTQDDNTSKINVETLFSNPCQADNYNAPNKEIKRYLLRLEDLEEFECFYNFVQDINEKYGEKAIFHLKDGHFCTDQENKFREMLGIWTDTIIK